tara:strand:- start:249 stop:1019 length:771 start_codon:yes stop_codon:yes gene_type:complete
MAEEQAEVAQEPIAEVSEQPQGTMLNQEAKPEFEPLPVPEGLPEKFKSTEDLLQGYKSLEQKLGLTREETKAELQAELLEQAYSERPETIGDYKIPEILDQDKVADNELLNWWANHSYDNGFSQKDFEKGIEIYAKNLPQEESIEVVQQEELSRLGDNANARIDAVSRFVYKDFPPETHGALEKLAETADGIIALETMMGNRVEGSVINNNTQPVSRVTEIQLREMMKDERYHNPTKRDQNFVNKVDAGFKELFRS